MSPSEHREMICKKDTNLSRRPHSSLDEGPPDQAGFNQPMPEAVAA
jgi:hypothetical protein